MLTEYQQNCAILHCLKAYCLFYLMHIGNSTVAAIIEILLVTFIAAKIFCQHSFLEEIPV